MGLACQRGKGAGSGERAGVALACGPGSAAAEAGTRFAGEGRRQVGPTSQPHGRERGLSRSGPMGERGPVAERWSECVRSALTSVLAARLASGPGVAGGEGVRGRAST